jgi:hypothetical protein
MAFGNLELPKTYNKFRKNILIDPEIGIEISRHAEILFIFLYFTLFYFALFYFFFI